MSGEAGLGQSRGALDGVVLRRYRQSIMHCSQHSGLRRLRALLVIALTLVPLALSGHQHAAPQRGAADSCAVCVAAHHAPAANLAPLPHLVPILDGFRITAAGVTAPAHVFRPLQVGRAPPLPLIARVT